MSTENFTFDPKNPKQLLHAQAFATVLILDNLCSQPYATARMHKINRRAQERVYRRFKLAYN